jgi:hypothetical protein
MIEGSVVIIDIADAFIHHRVPKGFTETRVPAIGLFDFIDHLINQANLRIAILIPDVSKQKEIEDWLITQHSPMLSYITIKSVVVTNSPPPASVIISSRAIRFTNWADMTKYFI